MAPAWPSALAALRPHAERPAKPPAMASAGERAEASAAPRPTETWQARQARLESLQRDIVECERVYARWAPTASWLDTSHAASLDHAVERLALEVLEPRRTARELAETLSWFGTPAAASLDQAAERLTLEVLQPRPTRRELAEIRIEEWLQQARAARRELAETRIEEWLQQALAAELCDILTGRPDIWEPLPDRLARMLCRAVLARRLEARQADEAVLPRVPVEPL